MRRASKRGKFYRLYSVTFSIGGLSGIAGSFAHYVAIPRLMPMLAMAEIEAALCKSGYDMARPIITAMSFLGEFRKDDLPDSGCVIIERIVNESDNGFTSAINTDSGPIMIRMDWIV